MALELKQLEGKPWYYGLGIGVCIAVAFYLVANYYMPNFQEMKKVIDGKKVDFTLTASSSLVGRKATKTVSGKNPVQIRLARTQTIKVPRPAKGKKVTLVLKTVAFISGRTAPPGRCDGCGCELSRYRAPGERNCWACLSEEPGQSPLAWQGGRLSRVIADFLEEQGLPSGAPYPSR